VIRANEALRLLRLPVAPSVIRARAAYQTVVEAGRSTEEGGDPTAALEMSRFCDFVDRFAFAQRRGIIARSEG
jgi:hypothetical protein